MTEDGGRERRVGAADSPTRAKLLDAAEQLMLQEGYAAVTSRRVGREAGISSQLVHYYFRTMDELFLEIFRRKADDTIASFKRLMAKDRSLQSIWRFRSDPSASVLNVEFVALANHRKDIQAEMARYTEQLRTIQLEAIRGAIAEATDGSSTACPILGTIPPEVLLVMMNGVAEITALEGAAGVTVGHDETLAFIDYLVSRETITVGTSPGST